MPSVDSSKDIFITEKVVRFANKIQVAVQRSEVEQFRIDAKALMCRGIDE